jgi:hypothetical protein
MQRASYAKPRPGPAAADRFARWGRGLTRWILGTGFLSLHIGIYLLAVVGLLLWNLARSPGDLWVAGPLRRWGLVVVFHATAVGAGWAAWRLMRMGTETPTADVPDYGVSATRAWTAAPAPVAAPTNGRVETIPARMTSAGVTAEEWARRWLRESVRVVRQAVENRAVVDGDGESGTTAKPTASALAGPEITEWGTLFARRAREMMAAARDHLGTGARPADGVDAPAAKDPTSTWPNGHEGENPPAPNGTWPAPVNAQPAPLPTPVGEPAATDQTIHERPAIDPLKAAAETDTAAGGGETPSTEEARWTWVEAAAAAWLARRGLDGPADDPPPTAPDATPPASEEPPAGS